MEEQKPINVLVLDAGPIIKNEPSVSTLLSQSQKIITIPSIINEIKDAAARARLDTTLRPFIELRDPTPSSVKVISDFARKTGDLQVLSRPDIHLLALAYELECEKNGGDWRLRSVPGQKRLNGSPPAKEAVEESEQTAHADSPAVSTSQEEGSEDVASSNTDGATEQPQQNRTVPATENTPSQNPTSVDALADDMRHSHVSDPAPNVAPEPSLTSDTTTDAAEAADDNDDDDDGWITPSNLRKHQAADAAPALSPATTQRTMQVACLTTDFAMQNVLLQMNLNLLSPSLQRVRHIKTYILRCHACFATVRDLSKQFCPRCGKPTLTRVACSTDEQGRFTLHLKKNMQWNTRGDRYSVPKPTAGTANGKVKAGQGGKGGWGQGLILAEDQKEYIKALNEQRRGRERDLMDEDYLPAILTGERRGTGPKITVGAGRNVNSKKR